MPDNTPVLWYELWYHPIKPIPETFALIIGDVVHNFRCALDHLCTGILRSKKPNAKGHFPMERNWTKFESLPVISELEAALPGARKLLLCQIRPYGGQRERLWSFNQLNNDDKHNLLTPTVTIARIRGVNISSGNTHVGEMIVDTNAAESARMIHSDWPIKFDEDAEAIVQLSFGHAKVFENEPVVPTLKLIGDVVTETLNSFERLILA